MKNQHTPSPNFFIVGAAKSGTTSLCSYLNQHPEIFLPPTTKEPHYFGQYKPKGCHIKSYPEYIDLFKNSGDSKAIGEGSTGYLYSPDAPQTIKRTFPTSKIIIVLRNPVDRAYSLYWHHVRDRTEHLSFEDALRAEKERIDAGWPFGFHHINSGLYSEQVKRYQEKFDKNSIKVILFDDFKNHPLKIIRECFLSLEVNPNFTPKQLAAQNKSGPPRSNALAKLLTNKTRLKSLIFRLFPKRLKLRLKLKIRDLNASPPPHMNQETRAYLEDIFKDDIRLLEKQINRDLSHWITRSENGN